MVIRRYKRTFHISACHFNSGRSYEDLAEVLRVHSQRDLDEGVSEISNALNLAVDLLNDVYGHNFEITVTVESHCAASIPTDYVIDDQELEKTVMAWHNKNLSMLPEFSNIRALTENMATVLASNVYHSMPPQWKMGVNRVIVDVAETKDIVATAVFAIPS